MTKIWIGVLVGIGAGLGLIGTYLARPVERSYDFVTVDHPVNMWGDGNDKWSYFYIGEEKKADLASKVRKELLPAGFKEDTTRRPWFAFVKGDEEVIVCNHNEFAVGGTPTHSKVQISSAWKLPGVRSDPSSCILVKNGPGTSESLYTFQIKKVLHGW